MTAEEILAIPPGRRLDQLVAEGYMGWTGCGDINSSDGPYGRDPKDGIWRRVPHYSVSVGTAWRVYLKAMAPLRSQRERFYDELQALATLPSGAVPAWPDVLTVLRGRFPEAVCKAALLSRPDKPCLAAGAGG